MNLDAAPFLEKLISILGRNNSSAIDKRDRVTDLLDVLCIVG